LTTKQPYCPSLEDLDQRIRSLVIKVIVPTGLGEVADLFALCRIREIAAKAVDQETSARATKAINVVSERILERCERPAEVEPPAEIASNTAEAGVAMARGDVA